MWPNFSFESERVKSSLIRKFSEFHARKILFREICNENLPKARHYYRLFILSIFSSRTQDNNLLKAALIQKSEAYENERKLSALVDENFTWRVSVRRARLLYL